MAILPSCSHGEKVVENPYVETCNTTTIDISRIELTDSATVLHVDAYYVPNYWIRIDSGTYIQADGKKYAITGSEGIQLDSLFWMPDSGMASFTLAFEPMPFCTKSFDFIESDCDGCFKIYGIDLTGKKEYGIPDGLPAEAMHADQESSVPDPALKTGETTVNLHLLNYRPELGKELRLYVYDVFGRSDEIAGTIDEKTASVTLKFKQYGPAEGFLVFGNNGLGTIWFSPGEEMDVYFDMRQSGWQLVNQRSRKSGGSSDAGFPSFTSVYVSGVYSDITNALNMNGHPYYDHTMNLYDGKFADYNMSADEYTDQVISIFRSYCDSVLSGGMSPLLKELKILELKQQAVSAMAQATFIREINYRFVHDMFDYDEDIPVNIEPLDGDNYRAFCQVVDINDPKLLMGRSLGEYLRAINEPDIDWAVFSGDEKGLAADLRKAAVLSSKIWNASLTEADMKEAGSFGNPFFIEALDAMQKDVAAALAAADGGAVIEKVPDVPVEKLFDAIIAPYKGKVILVDFWNTWCGPCRAAIEQNEPLKETELKSDDLVWIYIANETSPLLKYKEMIPYIKGRHFRLGPEQWEYIGKKMFDIDGIPSYVLVDKDGKYRLRNDFRNHDLMVSTLKDMLK